MNCDEQKSLLGFFIHKIRRFSQSESITIFCAAAAEPQIVTIGSDCNEPTFQYGFGSQHPINVPPSLNDLNLPRSSFNVLADMVVIGADEEYSHLSCLQ